jgi:[glutamine synthetase] adenylyltransferase / [glutamine synthetase]-adenylyl-L-tyrosine phosphorylase
MLHLLSRPQIANSKTANPAPTFDLALFRDPARARAELEGLHARLGAGMLAALPPLLSQTADPDQALSFLERFASQSGDESTALLDSDQVLLRCVISVFGHSHWLGETLINNTDLFQSLQRQKDLERSLGREDFLRRFLQLRKRSAETEISSLLARFKKREYIRIVLRDVLDIATLAETTAEISALADVLIQHALTEAESQMRHKYPAGSAAGATDNGARFAVLALGKLGGNELNYSSDVDLLYLYDGEESPGQISLREYCVRQAQLVTDILSRTTPEGAVFRIDLRLRPQGHEGEPAVALRHALDYYAHGAHDWELQALIKARYSAGDAGLAREFIRAVQPRVYTPDVNFAAVETAINSRRKIGEHRRRSLALRKDPATIDVKLDRGGIRDIEFLVQCLQRVYGGEEPWLRACGTLSSLQKLNDKGHLSAADFHELSVAYEFLRTIEHRLQLQRGQQVHRLPSSRAELEVLARAVHRDGAGHAAGLMRALRASMGRVAAIYERIVHSQKQRERGGAESAAGSYYVGARELSFEQVMQRIKVDSPDLYRAISPASLNLHARRNLHRFLSSSMTGAERYAVLLENPAAAGKALALFETSDYLADVLVRHPDMVRMLNDLPRHNPRLISEAESATLFSFDSLACDRHESLAMLRKKFRQWSFAVAAQDVLLPRPASAAMNESTRLADEAIRCALRVVQGEQSLAVFALGRLGTEEFDIASDADLLFVRAPEANDHQARLDAEQLVHALGAYTNDGSLFAVDARLRPHGGQGELVVSGAQLEKYLAEEAQPWEALTYSKLRFVAGRKDVAALLLPSVWHQIVEIGMRAGFSSAVQEMRAKLEKSNRYPNSFKLARGGFYDVDFMASYVMLTHANLVAGNTEERLERLSNAGLLAKPVFELLHQASLLYRTTDHAIRLVTGRARPELSTAEHPRQATEVLVNRILGRQENQDLQSELRATQEQVRQIFLQIVNG